jgi:hypothetical protein
MRSPRPILERLANADRAHQKEAGGSFLLRTVKYLCATLVALFVTDVALHLGPGWRLGLILSLTVVVLGLVVAAFWLAYLRRNRLEHIARFLEVRDPALGSKLINLLQLRDQGADARLDPMTRRLAGLAVDGYGETLRDAPLEQLARTGELRRQFVRAAWAGAAFLALLAGFFRITAVELARFIDPLGDHPPYSFTQLAIEEPGPEGTNVIYGRSLVVKARSSGHTPKEVFVTFHPPDHPERAVTLPMFERGRAGFSQQIDNLRTGQAVFVHTKDRTSISKRVPIGIVLTPQLERAFVRVAPPAYTGLPAEEKPYTFKPLQALAGSALRFRLDSNRPLREGRLEVGIGDQPPQPIPLVTNAENEVAATLTATETARLRFGLTDIAGLPAAEVWEGTLTVTHDLPPEIRVAEPERDCFVAIDFALRAHFDATDDYGLSSLRLHHALNGAYAEPEIVRFTNIVRDARSAIDLDFARLGAKPGDVISFFGEAIDTRPEPQIARSQTVNVTLISVEDYNNFIRRESEIADLEAKYGGLQDDLEDLVEQQRQLAAASDALRKRIEKANPGQQEELARALDSLLAQQNELNQRLDQHANRLDQFVRDMPVYDIEKEIQPLLRRQADAIRNSTRTNAATANDIARRSAPPNASRHVQPGLASDFKQAADDQVDRLAGARKQTDSQIAQTLEGMEQMQELLKDFNQFQALYEAQQAIVQHSQPYNKPGDLDRESQLALKDLGATEKQVDDILGQLEEKLRTDADAAADLFPKAAQSARDLADKISDARLQPLARQATGAMLAGTGDRAYRIADRLRGEMAKLFSECQSGNCPGSNELDTYLRLQRGLKPGNNFAQMSQSRRFGTPSQSGQGLAEGEGSGGASGGAVAGENRVDVRGNELAPNRGSASARDSSRLGKGKGEVTGAKSNSEVENSDALKGLKPVNRQSGAVLSETPIEEYHDVVDSYFKAIATGRKKNP